jgi:aryl-alcohol dehydrogenase-like predicted oxidoreductase
VTDIQIPTRRLGATGLIVSHIGLGLAALGRPAYINLGRQDDLGSDRSVAALERRCHEMLDTAYASGIRYLDAARSYGMAEHFLGTWLATRKPPKDTVTIGSKWGYSYTGSWRLDADVHVESKVLENIDVLRELQRLRADGLAIGLTVTGPRQADTIRRALHVRVDGVNPFQVVQATWNLLERSAGAALAEAHASGWGVIVKEAMANGRLTERAEGQYVPELRTAATARKTTIDAVALAAALSEPWADVVLSGAVSTDQLASNLKAVALVAASADWPSIAESPATYWERRSSLAWQ